MNPKLQVLVFTFATSLVLAGCGSLNDASLDTQAANTIRYEETIAATAVFPLSIEEGCVGYSGTVTVDATSEIRITEFVSGPNAGNILYLQRTEGSLFIEADDPATYPVTYSGSYVDNINFRSVRKNERFSAHLLLTATGTDGSILKFSFNFHILVRDGGIQIDNFQVNCIR